MLLDTGLLVLKKRQVVVDDSEGVLDGAVGLPLVEVDVASEEINKALLFRARVARFVKVNVGERCNSLVDHLALAVLHDAHNFVGVVLVVAEVLALILHVELLEVVHGALLEQEAEVLNNPVLDAVREHALQTAEDDSKSVGNQADRLFLQIARQAGVLLILGANG